MAEAEAEALEAKADTQAAAEARSEAEEETHTAEDRTDKTLSRRNVISATVQTASQRSTLLRRDANRTTNSARLLYI